MKKGIINAETLEIEIDMISASEEKITYGISEEKYSIGGETRISYGIVGYADIDSGATAEIIVSAHDLTSDREELAELVERCNRLHLSSIHFDDAVADFLNYVNV